MGYGHGVQPFQDRFWDKVDDSAGEGGCWPWMASRLPQGYGVFGIRNQGRASTMRAHVLALTLSRAEDPGGRYALHSCDNPPCCNPSHLRWGTQRENMEDMESRGRARRVVLRGERQGASKLTEQQVREIRRLYSDGGVTQQSLAGVFGISQPVVSAIVRREAWSHVD